MSDRRPDRVYALVVREGRAFLAHIGDTLGLPGGVFRPLAEDRKVELAAHLLDQLGIVARSIWAQGAFDYRNPGEPSAAFSGFYSVWEYDGEIPPAAGRWLDTAGLARAPLDPSLKVLLTSLLETKAMRTA